MTDTVPSHTPGSQDGPVAREPEPEPPLVWTGRIPLIALLAVGAVFLLEARTLDLGTLAEPGPGMWPSIVCVALLLVSAVALVLERGTYAERFSGGAVRALLGFVALVVTAYVFSYVGLILSATLFMLVWLRLLSRESWLVSVAVSVGASLGCYLLFVAWLNVYLPDDVVAQLWGGR